MDNQGWIWIIILLGIGVGLWSIVTPDRREKKMREHTLKRKYKSPLRTCATDPPPICDPQEEGGWGNCNDAQGQCALRRGCGTILDCSDPFTCTDALGPCIWY